MKNIHVLPTDKPSRLWINNLLQGKLELSKEMLIGSNTAQNIYITSNDNNKITDEGVQHIARTWVLDTINNKVFKASVNIISDDDIQSIILTTDQDLIAEGIQQIDDDFLEWFVKNPSCEKVEVSYEVLKPFQSEEKGYLIHCLDNEVLEEPKQETLKEAAEKWFKKDGFYPDPKQGFISGAKWQAKKGYSEEELRKAFKVGFTLGYGSDVEAIDEKDKCFNRWFKIFKNK